MHLTRLPVMLVMGAALSGCGTEAFSVTDEEKSLCVKAILKHASVGVLGDQHGYKVNSGTNGRTVQVNYPATAKRPGFSCVLHDGELVEVFRIERIFPPTGIEL